MCSVICRDKNVKVHRGSGLSNIPTGTVGAIAELIIANDLLKKGYEVYRPLSPSCSGDLLIENKNNHNSFLKIEVRTGYRHGITKDFYYGKANIRAEILAVVIFQTNEIIYLKYPSREIFEL